VAGSRWMMWIVGVVSTVLFRTIEPKSRTYPRYLWQGFAVVPKKGNWDPEVEASNANKAVVEQMKSSAVRRFAAEKGEAENLGKQLEAVHLEFHRKAGEKDHLFGSVTSSDIVDALTHKGFTIDRRKIQLDEPLKSIGEFEVPVKLHREVTSKVKVTVAKEAEATA